MSLNCNQTGGRCNITREELYSICRRHHVLPSHYRCFWRLADEGVISRASREFSKRLFECRNYRRTYRGILKAMWREIAHLWDDQRQTG